MRLIAFYLPQFHPIPENDRWWGAGFTEWRNVAQARPKFPGHYQPQLPADLGFYDLRLPESRQAQADLAQQYGIGGFCYWHYWFHGRRVLNLPLDGVLESGEPDFPFCLSWANENWTRSWNGGENEVLIEQTYSETDDERHIQWLLSVFADDRYIKVEGRPLFLIYRATKLPNAPKTIERWRRAARAFGFPDLFLCRVESSKPERGDPRPLGFDAGVEFQPDWWCLGRRMRQGLGWRALRAVGLSSACFGQNSVYEYRQLVENVMRKPRSSYLRFPGVVPSWDNSSRRTENAKAVIVAGSTPELYQGWLEWAIARSVEECGETPLVFINAWNEWAEGNHLEPDLKYGHAYLEATQAASASFANRSLKSAEVPNLTSLHAESRR